MKWGLIGKIGLIGGGVISVIGLGVMIGGGHMKMDYTIYNQTGKNITIQKGVGSMNWTEGKDFWKIFHDIDEYKIIINLMLKSQEIQDWQKKQFLQDDEVLTKMKTSGEMVIAGSILFTIFTLLTGLAGYVWWVHRNK